MSDTPETDAAWQAGKDTVFRVETSRKLERERDEANEKHRFAVIHWQGDVFKMQQERDEAREENAKLRDLAERAIDYLDQSYRGGFSDEASDLRYELEQLTKETK